MKTFKNITIFALLTAATAFGQANTLTATTTSQAIAGSDTVIYLTSITNIVAPSNTGPGTRLWIADPGQTSGEVMDVSAIVSTAQKSLRVIRGGPVIGFSGSTGQGTPLAHVTASMVLYGPPQQFYGTDPSGTCVTANTYVAPWLNVVNGRQWLCSPITKTWVPSWGNYSASNQPTVLVASVAGATAVNSPLQHVNGTNAITSFTMGAGWNGQGFCLIPDAAFTTTATNNIAIATTAVLNKTLCYTYDATNSKFTSSY